MAQGKNSIPTSPLPEPLWQSLLTLTDALPAQIQTFKSDSTMQVQVLIGQIDQLQTSIGDLNNSLISSKADLVISQEAQRQSEKALDDSISSTIRAQADAKALETQNTIMKWATGISVPFAIIAVVFALVKK
jgi:hypothetical protein